MRIGVVLGAGGLPADAFHRGVLAGVRDAWGFDARGAEVLVGTSAGAMTVASLRMQRAVPGTAPLPPTDDGQRRLRLLPDVMPDLLGLAAYAVRPWRARPGGLVAALLPPGRHSTDVLTVPLRRRFAGRWPERRSWIVAVRRRDGRRVVFGRDPVRTDLPTAVGASCAVPGFFRPVRIGGDEYVDGFLHSPTNADVLVGEGLDLAVVSAPLGIHLRGAPPLLDLPLRLVWHAMLRREVAALRRGGTPVLVVEPAGDVLPLLGLNPIRATRIDEIEERAYAQTVERLTSRPLASLAA